MPEKRRLPITLRTYRTLTRVAVPFVPMLIRRRLKAQKEDAARIGERRGIAKKPRPNESLIWIHGASVGEILAAAGLIERLQANGHRVLLTSGTVTSAAIASKRFPDVIHQYIPYDAPKYVARFLDHWRPDIGLFIESDLWPNLIVAAHERRVPMVLINARMSQRSFPRWKMMSGTISAMLGRFDLCLAQSQLDADRYHELGCNDVIVTGNLKLDVPAPPVDPAKLDHMRTATRGRTILLASSTHPGEEEILLAMHRNLMRRFPNLLTIIVPRHANRGAAIAQMLSSAGTNVALRSREEAPTVSTGIYVADTMGELGLFYRLASLVFMGGSLVPHGGQNPIEPILLGGAVLHGPHIFNFSEIYSALDAAKGARRVETPEELVKAAGHFLQHPESLLAMQIAGAKVVQQLGGALDRTHHVLQPYLMQMRIERGSLNA